ncbi:MAG: hypothetical protein JWM57_4109, partial [Phycisphaerales bacterium]|nr:hypothetical protein [Phycisphaerales bacterium]
MPPVSKSAPVPSISPPVKLADPGEVRSQLVGKHVCPFCGVLRADPAQPCPRCTLDDNNATRTATKQRIGPWFVLQARNPSAPGMKFATLQSLARRGHISPRSVVRGPTTEQMWTFVATVRGLSREFGLCFHCGEGIEPAAIQCPHCGRSQDVPADSDALMESAAVSPLPTPLTPPTPPLELFSSMSVKASDTGMDGGTSLDLQADSATFTPMSLEGKSTLPARVPTNRPTAVQRAPVPV